MTIDEKQQVSLEDKDNSIEISGPKIVIRGGGPVTVFLWLIAIKVIVGGALGLVRLLQ